MSAEPGANRFDTEFRAEVNAPESGGWGQQSPAALASSAPCFWTRTRQKLLLATLALKAVVFLMAIAAITLFPSLHLREYHNDIHWPREGPPTFATHFATWDGAHYLFLSEVGYESGSSSCAFYPLWPYLVRACSFLTFHNHLAAGLILANLLSLAAFLIFHFFVELHHGLKAANTAVALLLAYPGAIFFCFVYTESLFFLLVIAFFLCLFSEKYLCVALIGFLLPLTKAVGVFCIFPLVAHLWLRKARAPAYLAYYGPILGYCCYFGIMYRATGHAFEGFEAQRFYPNQPSIGHIFDVPGVLQAAFMPLRLHGMLDSGIDRSLFLLLLGSLFAIYRLKPAYFVYAGFIGIVPALSSWFLSYTRNVMMCFPLFILFGVALSRPERRFILCYVVLLMGTLELWFLLRHINFIWVA